VFANLTSVPSTSNVPTGSYTLSYGSGGPTGNAPSSITPSATQTLNANSTITFTMNFSLPSQYPESPHPYPNNYDNTQTYTLSGSHSSIRVTFDPQTRVESGFDYIYVMDGNGNNISGSPFTGTILAGQTVTVPGAAVKIRLTSDSSLTFYGFKVINITDGASAATSELGDSVAAINTLGGLLLDFYGWNRSFAFWYR
jgi:hypothetical protein